MRRDVPPSPHEGPLYFDAVLRPHRSLGPRGFLILMICVCTLSFVGGMYFMIIGAWPIFGFMGLDVLGVYIAFRASYRSGRLFEAVQLSQSALSVQRVHPSGRIQTWLFEPYWVQVHMDDPPEHGSRLTLRSHGKDLTIGSFLTPEERLDVAKAIREALQAQQTPQAT
jgi:uncharacterized membrane protein